LSFFSLFSFSLSFAHLDSSLKVLEGFMWVLPGHNKGRVDGSDTIFVMIPPWR
jgi:hypothetical protein